MKRVVLISMAYALLLLAVGGCHINDLDMKVKDVSVDPFAGSNPLASKTSGVLRASSVISSNEPVVLGK